MGLDSVELLMAVEEAFDIAIPDDEAGRIDTVGRLYALIIDKLFRNQSRRCPSSVLFYRTRRALMDQHGVPRKNVTPATPMESLLPRQGRRMHWQELGHGMGVSLPHLRIPQPLSRFCGALALVQFLICLALYFAYPVFPAISYTLVCALLAWMAYQRMTVMAVQVPAECATVGDTVRSALRRGGEMPPPAGRSWDPGEVWETLRRVIVDQLDVSPEAVTVEADLVRDFGMD